MFMPYRHPVAVTMSIVWWGVYLGSFGAVIGALLGLRAEKTSASRSQEANGGWLPSTGTNRSAIPVSHTAPFIGDFSGDQYMSPLHKAAEGPGAWEFSTGMGHQAAPLATGIDGLRTFPFSSACNPAIGYSDGDGCVCVVSATQSI
jgi:hypothetical protein